MFYQSTILGVFDDQFEDELFQLDHLLAFSAKSTAPNFYVSVSKYKNIYIFRQTSRLKNLQAGAQGNHILSRLFQYYFYLLLQPILQMAKFH